MMVYSVLENSLDLLSDLNEILVWTAVHTKISFKSDSKSKLFSKTEYTIIEIESTISDGNGEVTTKQIQDEFKIQLGQAEF